MFLSNLIPLPPPHPTLQISFRWELLLLRLPPWVAPRSWCLGWEAGKEVESVRRWGAEHILTFWSWLIGIVTLFPVGCGEYGFLCGKNGSNNCVLPKSGNRKVRGSTQRCLVETQLCLQTSWLPMNGISWLFRTVGVLKLSAVFTRCRYPLLTIHQHGQCFLWAWWKEQPGSPALSSQKGEKCSGFSDRGWSTGMRGQTLGQHEQAVAMGRESQNPDFPPQN